MEMWSFCRMILRTYDHVINKLLWNSSTSFFFLRLIPDKKNALTTYGVILSRALDALDMILFEIWFFNWIYLRADFHCDISREIK